MANNKPKQFTEPVLVRLSKEGKKNLVKKAKVMELKPAVAARYIIEHSVKEVK